MRGSAAIVVLSLAVQLAPDVPRTLPAAAVANLARSVEAAQSHARHTWRDTRAVNPDGTINGYVEIPLGDRRKWEFDMRRNELALDRVIPPEIGGYPVNYGFVPQTISYDGDPFDVLVLGAALPRDTLARGVIVGLMRMEDEKGLDSKVVISRVDESGRPVDRLTPGTRRRIEDFFNRYKNDGTGTFARVTGWGSAAEGRTFVDVTHAFFNDCRDIVRAPCPLRAH